MKRTAYFALDNGELKTPKLFVAVQKLKIQTILDVRGSTEKTTGLSAKAIKASAKPRKVLVSVESSFSRLDDSQAVSGLLIANHIRWPVLILLTPSQNPLLCTIQQAQLAELLQVEVKGFSVSTSAFTFEPQPSQSEEEVQPQVKDGTDDVDKAPALIPEYSVEAPIIEYLDLTAIQADLKSYSLPRDKDDPDFIQSFDVSEASAILEFFHRYGVVVINALSPAEASTTFEDLLHILESQSAFRWADPTTWNSWPKDGNKRYGMPSNPPVMSKTAFMNRQNPSVIEAFAILFQTDRTEIMTNLDRYSLMRPTKSEAIGFHPEWMSPFNVHLDFNPWKFIGRGLQSVSTKVEYDEPHKFISENHRITQKRSQLHVQALMNINTNRDQDGGFVCVPGFHHHFIEWAKGTKPVKGFQIRFPHEHWLYEYAQRVPVREGALIIWNQKLPHGSKPNQSDNYRAAQYFKMYPKSYFDFKTRRIRRKYMMQFIQDVENDLTSLGRSVLDL